MRRPTTFAKIRLFGPFNRYKLERAESQNGVQFMVTDAESVDEYGLPAVVRQAATESEAVAGLGR